MIGVYSNLYYRTRWVPLKRRGLGWHRCNKLYVDHDCIASCGLADSELEIVLDIKGCNLNCKYCWGWKMRNSELEIRKTPVQVVKDILCRVHHTLTDPFVSRSRYGIGIIRITGNEPTLQWHHLVEVMKILGNEENLLDICRKMCFDERSAECVSRSKLIVETNGVLAGMNRIDMEDLLEIGDLRVDFDVSFKGVNEYQFEWLSDMPEKFFEYQIKGFCRLFDFVESNSLENVNVNPVLGINHAENYCIWKKGRKYVVDVEIVDRHGKKMDFKDFSRDFEDEVLSRKDLRFDEAPFREYYGINRERTRLVVATIYRGKRYLHVLPSEIAEIVDGI